MPRPNIPTKAACAHATRTPRRVSAPWVVMLAGVSAAMHIGKMAPAIPALQSTLEVSLLEAGFLLSAAQLGGMLLGVLIGALADGMGLRRSLLMGLTLMTLASLLGTGAHSASHLLALRAVEGLGVLLATLPVPSLIRQLVPHAELARHLGWWGAYMPTGTALALVGGAMVISTLGWPVLWAMLSALTASMAVWVWRTVPPDRPKAVPAPAPTTSPPLSMPSGLYQRLRLTLSSPGPWLVALTFATYSSQWLAVVGFLPSVYADVGVAPATAGALTALVCAVNILGNVGAGQLLHRAWPAGRLLTTGFVCMAACTWLAFHPFTASWPVLRYGACMLFSAAGGLIPGTLFYLALRVAPSEQTVSTTVGWIQQCSSAGQFAGPPVVAWVAHQVGGWQWTWAATGAASAMGLILVALMPFAQSQAPQPPPPPH